MIERLNRIYILLFCLVPLLIHESLESINQKSHSKDINLEKNQSLMHKPFGGESKWIWTINRTKQPVDHTDNYRMAYFRRKFKVANNNIDLQVHVSADSRYILWCNGEYVGRGPAKGDIAHHFYDSYILDDLLKIGDNVIAVQVVSFAPSWPDYSDGGPPCSIMSATNGLVLDGILYDAAGEVIEKVHTDSEWRVLEDTAYRHKSRPECSPIVGLFEDLDGANYPWGWQDVNFDDSDWPHATVLAKAVRPDNVGDSFMPYRLIPRIIPFMDESEEGRFSQVIRCEGIGTDESQNLIQNNIRLEIPPNNTVKILYDVGHETTAFPILETDGGSGAAIRMKYAEVLYRNKQKIRIPDDKPFDVIGYWDDYRPPGGQAEYEPFWWRTFRFLELTVNTADAPLIIRRFTYRFIGYPFKMKAKFESSDPDHEKMWQVSWRTLRLCAHETFEDCPYWEQLQYAGDTQISTLLAYYMAGDHLLARQALRHFDWSRDWQGITKSRYPSRVPQIIPFWSLHWIFMNYDYYWHTGDLDEIEDRFDGLISVIDWFDDLRNDMGLIARVPYWCVADWSPDWHDPVWGWGIPPGTKEGASALVNFMYISSLYKTSELAERIGKNELAGSLRQRAQEMTAAVQKTFWSERESLYTDRPQGTEVSQLTNAWAVLSGVANKDRSTAICRRLVNDSTLCQAAFFGKFFVFRALSRAGAYEQAFTLLQPWREMLKMGCTTWPEDPSLGRSECHVWSSAPAYDFLAEILGIKPLEPGFATILIHPKLGNLSWARGQIPTPNGDVHVNCRIEKGIFQITGRTPQGIPVLIHMPSGDKKSVISGGDFSFSEVKMD